MTRTTSAARSELSGLYGRVEHSLHVCRETGLAFPSVFMGITGRQSGDGEAQLIFRDDPVFHDGSGQLNLCALCALLDAVLGAPSDMKTGPRVRPATANITLQLTGALVRGDSVIEARFVGFAQTARVKQSLVNATIRCGEVLIGHATSASVLLALPENRTRAPWPWLPDGYASGYANGCELPPHASCAMDANEQAALNACERAESSNNEKHSFIEHFWCGIPDASQDKAHLQIKVAPHLGNRIGHVQGGLLLGAAASVASAAASGATQLSNISAYFLSPAVDTTLDVRAHVTRKGRSLTLVNTRITDASGKRVLESSSQHVAI